MRCKNCGFDNEEGRYICANCGSPLYDEDEEITDVQEEDEAVVNRDSTSDDEKNKKSIIIIIVLAVILVALIAGIVVSAVTGKDEETTTESTTISTTAEETTKKQTTTKEETTTEKETTTEATTTTTQTTTSTTAVVLYNVYVDIDGNGSVTGDGSYEKGKKAVLTATPDEGWQFEGWYDNSTGGLVASGNKFTVNVSKDITYTAKFIKTETAQ